MTAPAALFRLVDAVNQPNRVSPVVEDAKGEPVFRAQYVRATAEEARAVSVKLGRRLAA